MSLLRPPKCYCRVSRHFPADAVRENLCVRYTHKFSQPASLSVDSWKAFPHGGALFSLLAGLGLIQCVLYCTVYWAFFLYSLLLYHNQNIRYSMYTTGIVHYCSTLCACFICATILVNRKRRCTVPTL